MALRCAVRRLRLPGPAQGNAAVPAGVGAHRHLLSPQAGDGQEDALGPRGCPRGVRAGHGGAGAVRGDVCCAGPHALLPNEKILICDSS